jgi:hypothetical protein
VLLALPAATANAVARMPVGFFDDPSYRWASETSPNLLSTQRTHSSIVHILASWATIATTKPRNALTANDPAYHLSTSTRSSGRQQYGFEVLLTIAQTPKWANGGKTPNYAPTNMNTLTQFAQMLAKRYNGAKPGVGTVRRFSVWNEPNLGLFLAPQFRNGKIVSPTIYAKLAPRTRGSRPATRTRWSPPVRPEPQRTGRRRASGPIRSRRPRSPHARWEPEAEVRRVATHPYPTVPLGPGQKVAYPNVASPRCEVRRRPREVVPPARADLITEYGEG